MVLAEYEKSRTIVEINGVPYTIVGSESSEHIKQVANYVNQIMNDINARNPYLDSSKLAVLTAINAASEYIKLKEKLEQLEKKVKD